MSLTLGGVMLAGGALVDAAVVVGEVTCAGKPLAIAKRRAMHRTANSVLLHFLSRYPRLIDERSIRIFLDAASSFYARKVGLCIVERSTPFLSLLLLAIPHGDPISLWGDGSMQTLCRSDLRTPKALSDNKKPLSKLKQIFQNSVQNI